jgi:hypothetical protein
MIKSYGLQWREDKVFWGRPNVKGTLMGAASRSARAVGVDFREQRGTARPAVRATGCSTGCGGTAAIISPGGGPGSRGSAPKG